MGERWGTIQFNSFTEKLGFALIELVFLLVGLG